MFRNLFLLIAIGLIIWIIQGFIRRSKLSPPRTEARSKDMVQCEQCKSYLPKDDAVSMNGQHFCNPQHLQDWNNKH